MCLSLWDRRCFKFACCRDIVQALYNKVNTTLFNNKEARPICVDMRSIHLTLARGERSVVLLSVTMY
jgi:hypothetical protein